MTQAQGTSTPIIDCHIHLFDQTRPQGAPYSGGRGNTAPSLPARYRKLASPLGIVGAIAIEASPWIEDNLWLLETEESDPVMVGAIGNLQPEKPEFKEYPNGFTRTSYFSVSGTATSGATTWSMRFRTLYSLRELNY